MKSNSISITVAAAAPPPPAISIAASSTSFPAAGGFLTVTGTSNYPQGSTMYLFYNGTQNGTATTGATGGFSFSVVVPANNTSSAVSDTVYVSDNPSGT